MFKFALSSVASLASDGTTGTSKRYCYKQCFNACVAKGGTNGACEFECAAAPPCDSEECDKDRP
jgi:hypothetical protein